MVEIWNDIIEEVPRIIEKIINIDIEKLDVKYLEIKEEFDQEVEIYKEINIPRLR